MNITDKEIKQFGLNIDKSLKDLSIDKKIRRDLLKMGFSLEAIEKFLKGGSK